MAVLSSLSSNFAIHRDAMEATTDFAAAANGADADLTWTDVAAVGVVLIERSTSELTGFVQIDEVDVETEAYTDGPLEDGTYYYRIRAYDIQLGYSDYSDTESVVIEPA